MKPIMETSKAEAKLFSSAVVWGEATYTAPARCLGMLVWSGVVVVSTFESQAGKTGWGDIPT